MIFGRSGLQESRQSRPGRPVYGINIPTPLEPIAPAPAVCPNALAARRAAITRGALTAMQGAALTLGGFGNRPLKRIAGVVMGLEARFQRLGPNAGGGAQHGTGGCRACDVVVVRGVARTAVGVAASWLGVCG
jgi:hypothetical protein